MESPISRQLHGIADYSYVPLSFAAPELFGFRKVKQAKTLCRLIGAGVLASALTTKAEWGMLKVVPFKVHLLTDISMGIIIAAAPLLFDFAGNKKARNTFIGLAITSIIVPLLTKNEEMKHG
ncbi:hypothetical protein BDE36_3207 [Arcticibacter tournemirensis]|uniref:Uncharacterized protein n=1 Tax=Arcticibacter tournemirensis TaxID=699437 RepID=A0A5M9HEB5_9SPHI|nr:hypothetical protein [Arcticibacter tournemirensis]KAA8483618.1 hypothetical protein F1649_08570 [Arcticibacter tournemirensis]TQM51429.1 hypothetical protein BDE36_3207 [Arcticibacter tournemirensis]